MPVIAIDFETANSRRDSACAVGLAWIEGGRVTRQEYRLIRPRDMDFHPMNIAVHGIHPRDVRHAPDFAAVFRPLLPEMEGALLLAHNMGFDAGVLKASLGAHGLDQPRFSSLCTLSLSRRLWAEEKSHKLSHVATRFGIAFRHHHAGDDAMACARIALEGLRHMGVESVAALGKATGLTRQHSPAVAVPKPRPAGIAARALGAMAALRAPVGGGHFVVAGSTGTPYDVMLLRDARGRPSLKCSCIAAHFKSRCKHVEALVAGDVRRLLSGNAEEVEGLAALFSHAPERQAKAG